MKEIWLKKHHTDVGIQQQMDADIQQPTDASVQQRTALNNTLRTPGSLMEIAAKFTTSCAKDEKPSKPTVWTSNAAVPASLADIAAKLTAVHVQDDIEKQPASSSDDENEINMDTLCVSDGIPVQVEKIPWPMIEKHELFFVCAACGKVFWDGSHFERVCVQFEHVLEDTQDTKKQQDDDDLEIVFQ